MSSTFPSADSLEIPKLIANGYLIVASLLFVFPTSWSDVFFTHALFIACALNIVSLFQRHGLPRLNMEYAQSLLHDDRLLNGGHAILCYFICIKPFMLVLVPHAIRSVIYECKYLPNYFRNVRQVDLLNRLFSLVQPYIDKVLAAQRELLVYGAVFEAYSGFAMLFLCFVGGVSFIGVFLYWQYLHVKYAVSSNLKIAFANVKRGFDQIFHNSYCPSMITRVYEFIAQKMYETAQPPQMENPRAQPS